MNKRRLNEKKRVLALTDGHCYYCGCEITMEDFHIDHFRAWSIKHQNKGNRVPACSDCNQIKSNHTPESFKKILKGYKTESIQVRLMDKYRNRMDEQGNITFYYETEHLDPI